MRLFIGRQRELDLLQRIYDVENVKTCMVYGRRRIGKSSLLRRFSEGRRTMFVQFFRASEAANAEVICRCASSLLGREIMSSDLHTVFDAVFPAYAGVIR